MFVWVLLILNDFQLDCKLIGTFSDHHAGPSRMQKPRRRPHFVFYLFKKKKRRRPLEAASFPRHWKMPGCVAHTHCTWLTCSGFFSFLAALYISKYACFSSWTFRLWVEGGSNFDMARRSGKLPFSRKIFKCFSLSVVEKATNGSCPASWMDTN